MQKKAVKKGLKSSTFKPMTVKEIVQLVQWADDFNQRESKRGKRKQSK
jgi:hypothetical protein